MISFPTQSKLKLCHQKVRVIFIPFLSKQNIQFSDFMAIHKLLLPLSLLFLTLNTYAKDYDASFFGIESNGTKLNTTSIQKAIDFIHEQGGGRLVFHVGRYVTGSIFLKSNVTLHLKEGAVLVGSLNPFDYQRKRWTALIFAVTCANCTMFQSSC